MVLDKQNLYCNLKKYTFLINEVGFFGYIVNAQGIKVGESKVEAIYTWQTPKSIHDVRRFQGLASFH